MYEIKPIAVDLSYVTFGNYTKTYDGEVYIPALVGNVPAGVQANISYPNIKNVGSYTAIVEFSVNSNYIRPSNLQAEITINPRPVYVEFSGYEDIVANGEVKSISVRLSNVVNNEDVGYEVIYSSTPIEAGNYTCSVELNSNSNYYIVGNSSIDFVIKVDKKVYNNNDIMVEVTGEHFLADSEVKLESLEEKQVVNTLKSINGNVKNYAMYKLVVDDENIGKVTVAIKSNTLSVNQSSYLRVYKLIDGGLEEIAFEVSDGKIIFEALPNDQLVLIQEENLTNRNITMVVIVAIVSSAIFVCLISIAITYIKQKKFFIAK